MPEALETWPVALMQRVLPRHLEIILRINQDFLDEAAAHRPGDHDFLRRLSLIDESGERRVRMAHLSIVGSHKVNGVSALHSDLLVATIFADFASLWPDALHQHDQRRDAAALAGPGQPGPGRADRRRPSAAAGGSTWTSSAPARSHADRADFRDAFLAVKRAQQGAAGRAHPCHHRRGRRPGEPVRRAGQAHPRIQAPVAQRAAGGGALPGHAGRPAARPAGCRAP